MGIREGLTQTINYFRKLLDLDGVRPAALAPHQNGTVHRPWLKRIDGLRHERSS